VEQTVAAGASPADAAKWWLNELARRANDSGAELTSLPITPADVARVAELVASGALNDRLPRPVVGGGAAGGGNPDEGAAWPGRPGGGRGPRAGRGRPPPPPTGPKRPGAAGPPRAAPSAATS